MATAAGSFAAHAMSHPAADPPDPERALVVRQPWLDTILSQGTALHARRQKTNFRGACYLAEQGSGMVKGQAVLTGCIPLSAGASDAGPTPQSPGEGSEGLMPDHDAATLTEGAWWGWRLERVQRFEEPWPLPDDARRGPTVWIPRAKWDPTLEQPPAPRASTLRGAEPWPKRLPRKPRSDKGTASAGQSRMRGAPPMLAARPVDSTTTAQGKKRAADAAELVVPGARAKRRCQGQDATKESASQRLAAGRTLGNLRDLMRTDLFHHQAAAVFHPGSFARLGNRDVFVLGTFRRRGAAMADVAPLDAADSSGLCTCRLNCVQTRPQQDLKAPAFAYLAVQSPVPRNRQLLHFRKHEPDSCPPHDAVERFLAASAAWRLSGRQSAAAADADPVASTEMSLGIAKIVPQACEEHVRAAQAQGERHAVSARCDRESVRFVLDLPLPTAFDARPYRCETCRHEKVASPSFPITDDDVRAAFPGVCSLASCALLQKRACFCHDVTLRPCWNAWVRPRRKLSVESQSGDVRF